MKGKDKLYHLIAGVLIAILAPIVHAWIFKQTGQSVADYIKPEVGLFSAGLIGLAKEFVWDMWIKKRKADFLDFFATLVGGVAGLVILLLFVNFLL